MLLRVGDFGDGHRQRLNPTGSASAASTAWLTDWSVTQRFDLSLRHGSPH